MVRAWGHRHRKGWEGRDGEGSEGEGRGGEGEGKGRELTVQCSWFTIRNSREL